ncbi:hypothetical protein PMAYCL1PPCAC_31488, partial [Pristionchus mayeri]
LILQIDLLTHIARVFVVEVIVQVSLFDASVRAERTLELILCAVDHRMVSDESAIFSYCHKLKSMPSIPRTAPTSSASNRPNPWPSS